MNSPKRHAFDKSPPRSIRENTRRCKQPNPPNRVNFNFSLKPSPKIPTVGQLLASLGPEPVFLTILRCFCVALFALIASTVASRAHKVTPTLGTFSVDGDTFTLELAIVAEGMVAGIDLDGLTDTSVTVKDA